MSTTNHKAWLNAEQRDVLMVALANIGSGDGTVHVRRETIDNVIKEVLPEKKENSDGVFNALLALGFIKNVMEDAVQILCRNTDTPREFERFVTEPTTVSSNLLPLSEEKIQVVLRFLEEQNLKVFASAKYLKTIADLIGEPSKNLGRRLVNAGLITVLDMNNYSVVEREQVVSDVILEEVSITLEGNDNTSSLATDSAPPSYAAVVSGQNSSPAVRLLRQSLGMVNQTIAEESREEESAAVEEDSSSTASVSEMHELFNLSPEEKIRSLIATNEALASQLVQQQKHLEEATIAATWYHYEMDQRDKTLAEKDSEIGGLQGDIIRLHIAQEGLRLDLCDATSIIEEQDAEISKLRNRLADMGSSLLDLTGNMLKLSSNVNSRTPTPVAQATVISSFEPIKTSRNALVKIPSFDGSELDVRWFNPNFFNC